MPRARKTQTVPYRLPQDVEAMFIVAKNPHGRPFSTATRARKALAWIVQDYTRRVNVYLTAIPRALEFSLAAGRVTDSEALDRVENDIHAEISAAEDVLARLRADLDAEMRKVREMLRLAGGNLS